MLQAVKIGRDSELLQGVLDIYLSVFPEYERLPVETVLAMEETSSYVTLEAYVEDGVVEGMSFVIDVPDVPFAYLLFLAVNDSCQGKGLGSKIIKHLRGESNRPLLVDVEPIDEPDAENADQRQARWRFYERNGFARSGLYMHYGDVTFEVLPCGVEVTQADIDALESAKFALYEAVGFTEY